MPRSLVGTVLRMFSAGSPTPDRSAAARTARRRALLDAQLLPEAVSGVASASAANLRVAVVGGGFAGLAAGCTAIAASSPASSSRPAPS
jgi:NADPH-dependent 2,4-dienoyl-CoA reductase/sulfur reductase-like enzyme